MLQAVTGVHGFCTPSRGIGTLGFASGSIFPLGCTKRHGPRHSDCIMYHPLIKKEVVMMYQVCNIQEDVYRFRK